jgi:hypothetical protein
VDSYIHTFTRRVQCAFIRHTGKVVQCSVSVLLKMGSFAPRKASFSSSFNLHVAFREQAHVSMKGKVSQDIANFLYRV